MARGGVMIDGADGFRLRDGSLLSDHFPQELDTHVEIDAVSEIGIADIGIVRQSVSVVDDEIILCDDSSADRTPT
jgi:hypothetical protein